MAVTTLPAYTRTIDDYFLSTWYEIQKQAIDNILDANVVTAALRAKGCFKTQEGGEYITRTVRYGKKTTTDIEKGSVLGQGEDELETMAMWTWRYFGTHIQRTLIDDQKNRGPSKIKSYIQTRIDAAREAIDEKIETQLFGTHVSAETGIAVQPLGDMVPLAANQNAGTYGKIARPTTWAGGVPTVGNIWWAPKYATLTLPMEVNLVSDMSSIYNTIHANKIPPDLLITTQELFELFGEYAEDKVQLVKDEATHLADLGFEVLRFRGKPLVWSPDVNAQDSTKQHMLFLCSRFVEFVYDPFMWFDMTEFKTIPLQLERIAHIVCACNMLSGQLRRHGRLYEA